MQVYLTGDAPLEIATLLADAGLEIVAPGNPEMADVVVTFGDEMPSAARGIRRLRLRIAGARSASSPAEPDVDFVAENPEQAASRILSWAFARRSPMLTGDPVTFRAITMTVAAAPFGVPTLIEGETGTGKGMLARLLHAASGRKGGLVAVNCALVDGGNEDEALLSAQNLFGAPGGAQAGSADVTVFLDNVDELSSVTQRRVLGEIRALSARGGGARPSYVASSSRPHLEMVARGLFDRDLWTELAQLTVVAPPLRERPEDISLLARHFLAACDSRLRFTREALRALSEYPFPGNVRELQNLVKRLSIVPLGGGGDAIDASDVRSQIIVASRQKAEHARPSWRASLEAANREIALRTVTVFGGDLNAAARKLGLSVSTLRRSMRTARVVPMPRRYFR